MLNNAGIVSLQVAVIPSENVGIFLHQVDVSLSCFRGEVFGQPDELWFGWRSDVHFLDVVAIWGQFWLLCDVVLVEESF